VISLSGSVWERPGLMELFLWRPSWVWIFFYISEWVTAYFTSALPTSGTYWAGIAEWGNNTIKPKHLIEWWNNPQTQVTQEFNLITWAAIGMACSTNCTKELLSKHPRNNFLIASVLSLKHTTASEFNNTVYKLCTQTFMNSDGKNTYRIR